MIRISRKRVRRQGGAALAEYGLLVAGITMASLVAVSVLGSKVGGLVASVATMLPGAMIEDNGIVQVGELVKTKLSGNGNVIKLDEMKMLHQRSQDGVEGIGELFNIDKPEEAAHFYQLGDRATDSY